METSVQKLTCFKIHELLGEEELQQLKTALEMDLKRTFLIHSAIDLSLRSGLLKKIKLKVYQAEDPQYKSFVCITPVASGEALQSISFHWDQDEIDLATAGRLLSNVPNWDWNKPFLIICCTFEVKEIFDRLYESKFIPAATIPMTQITTLCTQGICFTISKEDIAIPKLSSEYELGPLPASHASAMLSKWDYSFTETVDGLEDRLDTYKGVAVFYKNDNNKSIVAWTHQYMCGQIGITYTLPVHRNKKLGAAVTLTLAKQILDEGRTPYLMTEATNSFTTEFHKKLGFRVIGKTGYSLYLPSGMSLQNINI